VSARLSLSKGSRQTRAGGTSGGRNSIGARELGSVAADAAYACHIGGDTHRCWVPPAGTERNGGRVHVREWTTAEARGGASGMRQENRRT
jgi:hypothetical protein